MSKQMSIDDNTHKRLKILSAEKGLGLSQSIDLLLDLYEESKIVKNITLKEVEAKPVPLISAYVPPVIPPEEDTIIRGNDFDLEKYREEQKLREKAEIKRAMAKEKEANTPLAPLGRIMGNIGIKIEDEEPEKTEE